ncbi:class I SAM-dependent methyltransferase [Candidatus Micrarchaeota archaeon]|nr:class I SAM-dependent methyltransferase [Candidatus Micrarchaeota archaeon]MBU1681834.1 class I SAM-dependent methyltransferase [Candidatus Micrarchaeota archaeon]
MKSNWDKAASNYVDIIGETGSHSQRTYITPAMLEMVGNIKDKKVLDLGCGEGYFSRKVAELGAEVTGIDISAELVKIAKEKEKRKSLGIKYHNLSSESLDGIKDSSFDLIVSNMVLHNVKNLEATFAECSRVLKNNGRLIFVIIHPLVDTMKMASFDNDLQGLFVKLRIYGKQCTVPHRTHWNKGVVLYHRPFQYYFNHLFKSGFSISKFDEISLKHRSPMAEASLLSRLLMRLNVFGKFFFPDKSVKSIIGNETVLEFWEQMPSFVAIEATKNSK